MKQKLTPHYLGIDLLRGLGALLVLLFHEAQVFPGRTIFDHGYLAVDMFFMLSGFVLAARFEHDLRTSALSPLNYIILRFRRLYPLVAVGVLLGICVAKTGVIACGPLSQEALTHLLILPSLSGGFLFALNPALWSVFAELWINLAHAIIAPLLTTRRLVLLTTLTGVGLAVGIITHGSADMGSSAGTLSLGLIRTAFGFFVGVLSWRWKTHNAARMWGHQGCAVLFIFVVIVAGLVDDSRGLVDIAAILSFAVILKLAAEAKLEGLGAMLAKYAARISFPLYAIHYPILFLARHFIDTKAPSPDPLLSYAALTLLLLLLAALIAALPRRLGLPRVRSEGSSANTKASGLMGFSPTS